MKVDDKEFQVAEGQTVDLGTWPTEVPPIYKSKADYEEKLTEQIERLSAAQERLYAVDRYAVLLILQAMDTAGKDGVIRHVLSGINPQGCQVFSFKHPSATELDHDFLWRTTQCLPERGRIGVFNRSYYEEVLIARVHPEILQGEGLPDSLVDGKIWKERYRSIVDLEGHLHRNGTRIIKLFLHISKEEQRKRLLARLDDPEKNWKFNEDDIVERGFWPQYMEAYAACFSATSTEHAPWHVIPADDKRNARLIVAHILLKAMDDMHLDFPETTSERRRELQKIRKQLLK